MKPERVEEIRKELLRVYHDKSPPVVYQGLFEELFDLIAFYKKMWEALEFYGDEDNHDVVNPAGLVDDCYASVASCDRGEMARKALGEEEHD
ncbi:hypothetical protein LCGC14_2299040 [marine sediment metagenome]|uniref:Uncharacterized protein n=1 Tax=marine sediment metagenome TaxID=412755 RepID=A0A0F9FJ00_9ZZZZ